MSVRSVLAISALALSACGGGDEGAKPDAPRPVDARMPKVMEVTCPATTPVTFMTQAASFNPTTGTITMGQTVKFVSTQLDHPIGPIMGDPLSDPDLRVAGGQTKCFTFLATGTFKFICTAHFYLGTLTVN